MFEGQVDRQLTHLDVRLQACSRFEFLDMLTQSFFQSGMFEQ